MLHNEGDRWLHVDRMQPSVRMAASPDAKHLVDKTLADRLDAFEIDHHVTKAIEALE